MHRISLRGPWTITHSELLDSQAIPQRLPLPWRNLFGDVGGTAVFCRTFHAPTNLDETEVVRLVLTGYRGAGQVSLNGLELGVLAAEQSTWSAEITDKLRSTNRLRIELAYEPTEPDVPGGLYDVVELQIEQRGEARPSST
ncbi:hypothetical protein GC163_05280 [bacterium]|nr:hypothetical protein [bacterium]